MGISIEYAAGFFDGEGSVSIQSPRKSSYSWRLDIRVGQNDPAPLYELQRHWGGSVSPVRERHYQWCISSRKAAIFLRDIFPYLIVKKKSAKIGLELTEHIEACSIPGRGGLSKDEHLARQDLKHRLQLSQRWGSLERLPLRKVGVPSV